MALAREQKFDHLDGEEAKEILEQRFHQLLHQVPWLQRHLTLPYVRMILDVRFEFNYGGPNQTSPPEIKTINDECVLISESTPAPSRTPIAGPANTRPRLFDEAGNLVPPSQFTEKVDARGLTGSEPDRVREEHGLPMPEPTRGPVCTEDPNPALEVRRGFVREMGRPGTMAIIDKGPAFVDGGKYRKPDLSFGNDGAKDPAPPNFEKFGGK